MFTVLNVVYDHFLTRKPPFLTLFILSSTSDNTTSQNIGGGGPMAHAPQILGGPSPQSHLSLRLCPRGRVFAYGAKILRMEQKSIQISALAEIIIIL